MNRIIAGGAALALVVGLGGCGSQKKEALTKYAEIEAACKAGDKALAKKLSEELVKTNEAFKKAFDEATNTVSDKSTVNHCGGLVMTEIKLRLEN
jgi:hypothetical protein